ncbi:MAG TPA: hypothetical protein VFF06_19590 [Polyangia bacterium]|nr:hypothetical protein [Polyangia bacterium]
MMLGVIDEVDGHFVATKFLALLLPTGSMYVTKQTFSRSGNVSSMSWEGVPIPFQWKSAALAYPRVWLWFLGVAWPFLTHWGENVSRVPSSAYYTSLGMFAAALLALIPGRPSAREKNRLRALGVATGMRLDPKRLYPATREVARGELEDELKQASLPTTPKECAAAGALPRELVARVYAFACYSAACASGAEADEWRAAAAQLLPAL